MLIDETLASVDLAPMELRRAVRETVMINMLASMLASFQVSSRFTLGQPDNIRIGKR